MEIRRRSIPVGEPARTAPAWLATRSPLELEPRRNSIDVGEPARSGAPTWSINDEPLAELRRRNAGRIAAGEDDAQKHKYDENIFDDSDFYQQLLKQLLGGGDAASDISDGNAHRPKKQHRNVDRSASKGRKVRCVPCMGSCRFERGCEDEERGRVSFFVRVPLSFWSCTCACPPPAALCASS